MKTGIYCIAHTIREHEPAIGKIIQVRDTLERHGIKVERPKMGYHVTAISPFRASEEAAKLAAWALDYWDAALISNISGDIHLGAFGTKFDFFRNDKTDTLVVRLEVDKVLGRAIERGRKKIPDIAEWIYPPENYDFNAHVTIGEGKDIYAPVNDLLTRDVIPSRIASTMILRLEPPKVLRKNEASRKWEPVG